MLLKKQKTSIYDQGPAVPEEVYISEMKRLQTVK